jgi:acyl carrier protein
MLNAKEFFLDLLLEMGVSQQSCNQNDFNFVFDAELDSFQLLSLISEIEAALSINIPIEMLECSSSHTIGGFLEMLEVIQGT